MPTAADILSTAAALYRAAGPVEQHSGCERAPLMIVSRGGLMIMLVDAERADESRDSRGVLLRGLL
jgi:hypothetical protein